MWTIMHSYRNYTNLKFYITCTILKNIHVNTWIVKDWVKSQTTCTCKKFALSINIITGITTLDFFFLFYKFIVSITYKNSQFGMKTLLSFSTAILCWSLWNNTNGPIWLIFLSFAMFTMLMKIWHWILYKKRNRYDQLPSHVHVNIYICQS